MQNQAGLTGEAAFAAPTPWPATTATANGTVPFAVLRCAFCGLGEGQIARLFEGRAGHICDECVEVCLQLLDDFDELGLKPPRHQRPWYKRFFGHQRTMGECSFNTHGPEYPQGERIFPGNSAQICEDCIRTCDLLKAEAQMGN